MLGWYQEDYADFKKTCRETLTKIQNLAQSGEISQEQILKYLEILADQQHTISCYIAERAGVDDY